MYLSQGKAGGRRGPRRFAGSLGLVAVLVAVLASAVLGLVGCSESSPEDGPDDVVEAFVAAMVRSKNDRLALREAYLLLDRPARRALARRSEEATALSGRRYHPWDMLPQGRFRLRFTPRPGAAGYVVERVGEGTAVVRVVGRRPGEEAAVPVVDEDGVWRVHLAVPAMGEDEPRSDAPTPQRPPR